MNTTVLIPTLTLLLAAVPADAAVAVRILLGVNDTSSTNWSGGVTARGAKITAVEPWRFDGDDAMQPGNRWKISTHVTRRFGTATNPAAATYYANGVVVQLEGESEDTALEVATPRGAFAFKLSEIPFGKRKSGINGKVMADRVPPSWRISSDKEEQDYPAAAADSSGAIWLAYLEFKHHPDHDNIRNLANNFENMTAKPGGDQILLRKFSGGVWGEPIAITPSGGDLYRPAIAVDGKGRPWVFWSANEKNDFDLFARVVENGKPGATARISSSAGSDIDPAACTDSSGRVWVAWQGWRNGKAAIFAATQNGDAFSKPVTVASSSGNEWNPAIAADSGGRVSVAWDSYRNGSYDVFVRTAASPASWGKETPVAATGTYEAYPSITYDPAGVLWVAYEEGNERWGKDFGSDESTGYALYAGRAIRLRGLTKDGRMVEPSSDPGSVLPGTVEDASNDSSRQTSAPEWRVAEPEAWKKRGNNRPTPSPVTTKRAPRNTMPRLTADSSGRLWLASRSPHPFFWTSIGTVYTEVVTSYSGSEWTPALYLHHSDNLLDNRPALVAAKAGELVVINSSDGRRQFTAMSYMPGIKTSTDPETPKDPYNNDLYMTRVSLPPASAAAAFKAGAPAPPAPAMDSRDKAEQQTVSMMRNYRFKTGGGPLRILRGEFHRHSEISMDGGNDGSIIDQYRYMLDASYMDWVGCCDHDNGGGREYTWWISQKLTDIFNSPKFVSMFQYERSVQYPEGHRNVIFAQRGVRPLPRLQRTSDTPVVKAPDTQMLYRYLKKFNGIVASHTSGTNMGTDWRDNDPDTEPVVEIYQGERQNYEMPGAPRSNNEKDSIGGWRPKGFVNLALEMGYKLSFQASSDHISTHMSYCNLLARDATREAALEAFKKRHVYGATDHILAEFTSGGHMMGDAFSSSAAPSFRVKLTGTAPFAKVHVIKNNQYVYSTSPGKANVDFTWRDSKPDPGKTSYYYVRGEQSDGEIVWVSPMWITYQGSAR
ncbi:MAG TPA: hypothetical protein VL285_09555 [Bryobacteraceae bacterium]|nr:hypothetical protein [Bryobacteraceae bacterium]